MFYHPPSKQTLTCGDGFRFDSHSPAGPQFGQHYEGEFQFTTKSARENSIHIKPTHETNNKAYVKDESNTINEVIILDTPLNETDEQYTVQNIVTGDILQVLHSELLDHDPTKKTQYIQDTQKTQFPHIPWLKHDAKATLYLPTFMP